MFTKIIVGAAISSQDYKNVYAVAKQLNITATEVEAKFLINTGFTYSFVYVRTVCMYVCKRSFSCTQETTSTGVEFKTHLTFRFRRTFWSRTTIPPCSSSGTPLSG